MFRKKGISTLRIYQYWIFHHTYWLKPVLMKSSGHEKLWRFQIINPPIFNIALKLGQLFPQLNILLNSKNMGPWWLFEYIVWWIHQLRVIRFYDLRNGNTLPCHQSYSFKRIYNKETIAALNYEIQQILSYPLPF